MTPNKWWWKKHCGVPQSSSVQPRLRGYKTFSMFNSTKHEIFLPINVKLPTIVGILTFISRENSIIGFFEPESRYIS